MKIKLSTLFFLLSTFYSLLSTSPVHASGEFTSHYNVTYYLSESGPTQVVQNISLTNNLSNFYAAESEITVGTVDIDNVNASDALGALPVKITKSLDSTKTHVFFNEKVVGKGKTLNWRLSYQTTQVVNFSGQIKEINLPRLELDPDISEYNLSVIVPKSWGKPTYVKPVYKENLTFNKTELSQGQISIAFGDSQILNFKLKYHLKNPGLSPVLTEIALPPDTNYQKIFLKTLDPSPLNIILDDDGNWLAKYKLSPNQVLEVTASGSAQIFLKPKEVIDNKTSRFLGSSKYWATENPEIQKLAKGLKTVENIYRFVVTTLKYNYEKVNQSPNRLGALAALKQPDQAICMEFTDLFIALARAAGIPAREVNGFAYTTNERLRPLSLKKDILHAWPEYWDGKTWVQVDPTWENTTGGVDFFRVFDFNHFAFVVKGKDSQYPYPGGSYKLDNVDSKDVETSFGTPADMVESPNVKLEFSFPNRILSGFQTPAKLLVYNLGTTVLSNQEVKIAVPQLGFGKVFSTDALVPRALKELDFLLPAIPWYQSQALKISASTASFSTEKIVYVQPLILIYFLPFFAGGLLLMGVLFWKTFKTS